MNTAIRYPQTLYYYIGTGLTGAMYTLRVAAIDMSWSSRETYETSYHVKTLCTDLEKSISDARAYLAKQGITELVTDTAPALRAITRDKIDHSVLRFGKHRGRTVQELAETERSYLVWVAMNMTSKKHAKTLDIIKDTVADDIAAAAEKERRAQAEREERELREAERLANLQHVGTPGERITLDVVYKYTGEYETRYGWIAFHVFQDTAGNELVWKTTKALQVDDNYTRAERGQSLNITATVKEHGEYEDKKQTRIIRLKVNSYKETGKK